MVIDWRVFHPVFLAYFVIAIEAYCLFFRKGHHKND